MPSPVPTTRPAPAEVLARLSRLARPLLPLPGLQPAAYARGHAAFEACSDQRVVLASELARRVRPLLSGAAGRGSVLPAGRASVLSVGCGDGRLDVRIAEALLAAGGPLAYDGIDPDPAAVEAFRSRLSALDGLTVTAHVGRAEQLGTSGRYDVVLAVHCLYYVDDLGVALRRLAALVRPGGTLVLALAPQAELNALPALLAPSTGGHRQWWSHDLRAALAGGGYRPTASTLAAALSMPETPSRDVLDFTVQARLPDQLVEPVVDYLRSVSTDPTSLRVPHPVELFVLRLPERA